MKTFDLRDCWDDCYPGFEDFSANVNLNWNRTDRRWENETVYFEQSETLGWSYRTISGKYNYGYVTLQEAVIKYTMGLTKKNSTCQDFCAHKLQDSSYHQDLGNGTISCSVTVRYFLPECDQEKFDQKCNGLTEAFNLMLQ